MGDIVKNVKMKLVVNGGARQWIDLPDDEECEAMTDASCDLVKSVQHRLDYTCIRLQWLWVHMFGYTFLQLFMTSRNARKAILSKDALDRDLILHYLTDAFHFGFGLFGLTSILVVPAAVTH